MPTRVVITPTEVNRTGVAPVAETVGDATNGHTIPNDGNVFLLVHNVNATTVRNLTIRIAATTDGQAVASRTYAVPGTGVTATSSLYIGPFPPGIYGANLLVDEDNAEMHLSAYHHSTT